MAHAQNDNVGIFGRIAASFLPTHAPSDDEPASPTDSECSTSDASDEEFEVVDRPIDIMAALKQPPALRSQVLVASLLQQSQRSSSSPLNSMNKVSSDPVSMSCGQLGPSAQGSSIMSTMPHRSFRTTDALVASLKQRQYKVHDPDSKIPIVCALSPIDDELRFATRKDFPSRHDDTSFAAEAGPSTAPKGLITMPSGPESAPTPSSLSSHGSESSTSPYPLSSVSSSGTLSPACGPPSAGSLSVPGLLSPGSDISSPSSDLGPLTPPSSTTLASERARVVLHSGPEHELSGYLEAKELVSGDHFEARAGKTSAALSVRVGEDLPSTLLVDTDEHREIRIESSPSPVFYAASDATLPPSELHSKDVHSTPAAPSSHSPGINASTTLTSTSCAPAAPQPCEQVAALASLAFPASAAVPQELDAESIAPRHHRTPTTSFGHRQRVTSQSRPSTRPPLHRLKTGELPTLKSLNNPEQAQRRPVVESTAEGVSNSQPHTGEAPASAPKDDEVSSLPSRSRFSLEINTSVTASHSVPPTAAVTTSMSLVMEDSTETPAAAPPQGVDRAVPAMHFDMRGGKTVAGRDIACHNIIHYSVETYSQDLEPMEFIRRRIECVPEAMHHLEEDRPKQRSLCTPSTCEKPLADLMQWARERNSSSRLFWLEGKLGTGKTTIATTLCARLAKENLFAAGFFCNPVHKSSTSLSRVIPTVAVALAHHHPGYREQLVNVLKETRDVDHLSLSVQLRLLIVKPFQNLQSADPKHKPAGLVVVLAGLDQSSEEEPMKDLLEAIEANSLALTSTPLKFLIVSNSDPITAEGFDRIWNLQGGPHLGQALVCLGDLAQDSVSSDIRRYVRETLEPIALGKRWDQWPPKNQVETLVERAGRLFLYAATACRWIGGPRCNSRQRLNSLCSSDFDLQDTGLDTEPIDSLYRGIVARAFRPYCSSTQETKDLRMVLASLVCVRAPLSLQTLARFLSQIDVRVTLSSLHSVVIVPAEGSESGVIAPFHSSFRSFLTDPKRATLKPKLDEAEPMRIHLLKEEIRACHELVAQHCFKELYSALPQAFNVDASEANTCPAFSEAAAYAAQNAIYHLLSSVPASTSTKLPSVLSSRLSKFLKKDVLLLWIRCLSITNQISLEQVDGLRSLVPFLKRQDQRTLLQHVHDGVVANIDVIRLNHKVVDEIFSDTTSTAQQVLTPQTSPEMINTSAQSPARPSPRAGPKTQTQVAVEQVIFGGQTKKSSVQQLANRFEQKPAQFDQDQPLPRTSSSPSASPKPPHTHGKVKNPGQAAPGSSAAASLLANSAQRITPMVVSSYQQLRSSLSPGQPSSNGSALHH